MKVCKRCEEVKFGFQFYSIFMGMYTAVYDICKKCANELKEEVVRSYLSTKTKTP